MNRREFLRVAALAGVGVSSLPVWGSSLGNHAGTHSGEYRKLVADLLKDWCDGMIRNQVVKPEDPAVHGSLDCPACEHIHGRCMDAVYPFLYMADTTGDTKYLKAAILVMEWAEQNVSQPDGSWTVIPNPRSWRGITVFGAIALAEALKYHGHILPDPIRQQWMERLGKAGDYIHANFSISFTNINYGATAVYGLNLIGHFLVRPDFVAHSHELAQGAKLYFTQNDSLLFGEIKPSSDKISEKGLKGIDLGYNVEESLNSLVMYALHEKDKEFLELLKRSLDRHLEFMLPDGAWDNSWGTRQYKWSYWGSRTCDGSQPAFAMMADRNGAYGSAAILNTELLQRCTDDGLLHGGLHFVSHGVKPCIHHTFAHAKPLATLLDHWEQLPALTKDTHLPRTTADGIEHFRDLNTSLFARGDWRGTVTAYDAEYHYKNDYRQATGAALSMLYHLKAGPVLTSSMAVYKMVEKNNQQPLPGEDIALTPRLEVFENGEWYTNLFDLSASYKSRDRKGRIEFAAFVVLKNEDRKVFSAEQSRFTLHYNCTHDAVRIVASGKKHIPEQTTFVLPVVSRSGEQVVQKSDEVIVIQKRDCAVVVTGSVPLKIRKISKSRTFNQVPGFEAIPIDVQFGSQQSIEISIEVI